MEDERIEQDYQKDYFESVIRKYECRNALYTRKQQELRKRLETIEHFLPAIMCYNMMQTKTESVQPARVEYDNSPVKEEPIVNIRNEKQPFKNPRDDRNLRSCNCNVCPLDRNYVINNDSTKAPTTSFNVRNDINMRSCSCNPCPISKDMSIIPEKNFTENEKPALTNENLNSDTHNLFKADDIRCMNRIRELAKTERKLTEELTQLNHKERTYADSIQQPIALPSKDNGRSGEGDFECEALKRINQQLECDNKTLDEELEQVKTEIKHLHNTVEEPIKQELENEKCKCLTLEERTHKRSTEIKVKEIARQNQIDFLKRQLQSANQNLHNLHIVNKRLKEELCMLNCKCNELQTDVINQKISEIRTVSRIVASRSKELPTPSIIKPIFPPSRSDTGEDLTNIARNLSKLIQDAKSCKNCKNAHMDMIDTVQYIKNLVDIVNVDKKIFTTTDTESEIFCKCVDWKKLREEIQMEEPTYELLSPKKIHSAESTSSATTDKTPRLYPLPKKKDRSSIVEAVESIPSAATEKTPPPPPSKKEDRKRSAVETAENMTHVLLQDIIYEKEDRIEEDHKGQEAKDSADKLKSKKEMEHEGIKNGEIDAETEFTEKITDVSVTQSGTEQLFDGFSELPTDTTEGGGGDMTSEIDETEDFTMDATANEQAPTPTTTEDVNEMEAPQENTEEGQAVEESQAISIPDKEGITEEIEEYEEVPKTDEGGVQEESSQSPDGEIKLEERTTVEGTLKPIEEEKEEQGLVEINLELASRPKDDVNEEEHVTDATADEEFRDDKATEVIPYQTAKEDGNTLPLKDEFNLDEEFHDDTYKSIEAVSEEPAKGDETTSELKEEVQLEEEFHDGTLKSTEEVPEEPPREDEIAVELEEEVHLEEEIQDDTFTSTEVISEETVKGDTLEGHEAPNAEDEISPKEETVQMQELVTLSKQTEVQEVTPEDEKKEELVKETLTPLQPIEESVEKLHTEYDQDDFVEPVISSSRPASVADIVKRTICKCVKREQLTLCDCTEKGKAPTTVSSVSSKELHIKTILSDVIRKSVLKDDFITKSVSKEVSKKSVQSKPSGQKSQSSPKVSTSTLKESSIKLSSREPSKKTLSEEKASLIDKSSSVENKRLSKKSEEVPSPKVSKTRPKEPITVSAETPSLDTKVDTTAKRSSEVGEPMARKSSEQSEPLGFLKIDRLASKEPAKKLAAKETIKKTFDAVISALKSRKAKPYSDTAIMPRRQFGFVSREEGKRSLPLIITPEQASILSTPNQRSVKSLSETEPSKGSETTEKSFGLPEEETHKFSSVKDAPGTVTAIIDTEGNVPIEAEIELLPKSSVEGVYVTTTVTSSGHVEVTTEGPTGVVETTLKVTKSGNLEVVTGVTEYDQLSIDSVKEIESNPPHNIPVEVIHHPISNVKDVLK